jgi:hypothetical protein
MKRNKETKDIFLRIPAVIDKDKRLSTSDRYLLGCMINLDNEEGCYATNSYLAERLNCSLGTISRSVKWLEELGYVTFYKNNRGRGFIRHVREDLKYKKPTESFKHTTPSKKTDVVRQNAGHIYKGKEKYLKNENISIKMENKLVQNELDIPIPNKVDFYNSCKKEYNKHYTIAWDKEQVESLIDLCNKLYQSFKGKIDLKKKELSKCLLQIFIQAIIHKPHFFTDSLPQTFVRFWNKVIQQPKFERSLSGIEMDNTASESF